MDWINSRHDPLSSPWLFAPYSGIPSSAEYRGEARRCLEVALVSRRVIGLRLNHLTVGVLVLIPYFEERRGFGGMDERKTGRIVG